MDKADPSQLDPELEKQYAIAKAEYKQLVKIVISLEDEKKEHRAVLDSIESLEEGRRCFRSVGGVLVEHKVGEARVALQTRLQKEVC